MVKYIMNDNAKGQSLIEFLLIFGIIIAFFMGFIECARILSFKYFLNTMAFDVASQLAGSELIFEKHEMLTRNVESSEKMRNDNYLKLHARIAKVLDTFPSAKGWFLINSIGVAKSANFRVYIESDAQNFEGGIKVHINACLPFLFYSFTGDKVNYNYRNCLGEFNDSNSAANITSLLSRPAWNISGIAFSPRHVSYQIFKYGLAYPTTIFGITPSLPDVLVGSEQYNNNSLSRTERNVFLNTTVLKNISKEIYK